MDVGVPPHNIGMSVMLHVVLMAPVFHGKSRKKRKGEGCQRKVARLRLAGRGMNAFVTDHGNRCGEQSGHRQQKEANFEGEGNVCRVKPAQHGQEDDDLRPRLGGGFVEKAFFLQLFA